MTDYGLSAYDCEVLTAERATADYFEELARGRDAKLAANWVVNELFGALGRMGQAIEDSPIAADRLGRLVDLVVDQTISGKIAKDVFQMMLDDPAEPATIVEARGLRQVSDEGAIERLVDEGDRGQPQAGGGGARQPQGRGLARRPGDEGEPGQGQPQARGRDHPLEARRLSAT